MKLLWTLLKVAVVAALLIPLSIIVLATALGVLGALVGLAFVALRIAIIGLLLWGGYRLFKWAFFRQEPPARVAEPRQLPPADPHYEAAMRELDRELGHAPR